MGYLSAIQNIINGNSAPVFGGTGTGNNFANKFAFNQQELEDDPLNKQLRQESAQAGATAARNANMSAASGGYGNSSFATEAANSQSANAQDHFNSLIANNASDLRKQGLSAAEAGLNVDNSIFSTQTSDEENKRKLLADAATQDENHSNDFMSSVMTMLTGVGMAALPGGGSIFGGLANGLMGAMGLGKKAKYDSQTGKPLEAD